METESTLPDTLLRHLIAVGQADILVGLPTLNNAATILDVVRALEARTYAGTGTLVLEVVDRDGFADGRYRLDAGPDGASCVPTSEDGDLVLDVADLATLWLGDESAVRLAALGRAREQRKGAASVADALLRTSRRPWCPDIF